MYNSMSEYSLLKQATSFFQPEQKKKEWYEELEEEVCSVCPALTYQQRITGCIIMMAIGFFLSMGSLFRLIELLKGRPQSFAVMYTLGNIVSICSTCFLFGPWSQAKKMFAFTRIVATSVYFFFMGLCLFLAFYPYEIPLRVLWLIIAIFIQFLALIWYTLSFIPFAREIVTSFCANNCCYCVKDMIPSASPQSPSVSKIVSLLSFGHLAICNFCYS